MRAHNLRLVQLLFVRFWQTPPMANRHATGVLIHGMGVWLAQLTLQQVGTVPGPVLPQNVTGELDLTQGFGPLDNGTAATRGYVPVPNLNMPLFSNGSQVRKKAECGPLWLSATSAGCLVMS